MHGAQCEWNAVNGRRRGGGGQGHSSPVTHAPPLLVPPGVICELVPHQADSEDEATRCSQSNSEAISRRQLDIIGSEWGGVPPLQ